MKNTRPTRYYPSGTIQTTKLVNIQYLVLFDEKMGLSCAFSLTYYGENDRMSLMVGFFPVQLCYIDIYVRENCEKEVRGYYVSGNQKRRRSYGFYINEDK